jgi:cyclopropane-fatty-acyl-phospholipid synthase
MDELSSRIPLWGQGLAAAARRLAEGELVLKFANGAERVVKGAKPGVKAVLEFARARALPRMLFGGAVGLAESYFDGDWSSPDLASVIALGAHNEGRIGGGLEGALPQRLIYSLKHRLNLNTREGARRNIQAHYDLGNAFYREWLDPTMTYSSALFESGMTLEEAQRNKWRRIAEQLELKPGDRVLEIGCGWGGFAIFAARDYGAQVTGLTLSKEQHDFARAAVEREGLGNLIDIRLEDYRDVQGTFDRIVSIEMFEAIGERQWKQYFDVCRERLKPGGLAALQIITIADDRFEGYRRNPDFIQLYIFPGGMLPSPSILDASAKSAGLGIETMRTFALSYADTLKEWRDRFDEAWPRIAALGFDERFKRMWDYYLAYCEGGFRAGAIDVGQFLLRRA